MNSAHRPPTTRASRRSLLVRFFLRVFLSSSVDFFVSSVSVSHRISFAHFRAPGNQNVPKFTITRKSDGTDYKVFLQDVRLLSSTFAAASSSRGSWTFVVVCASVRVEYVCMCNVSVWVITQYCVGLRTDTSSPA